MQTAFLFPESYHHQATHPMQSSQDSKSPTLYNFSDRAQQALSPRDLSESPQNGTNTIFLGAYRDEGDALLLSSQSGDREVFHHLRQTIVDRMSELVRHLRLCPHVLEDTHKLIIRDPHYADISSSIASESVLIEVLSRVAHAPSIRDLRLEDIHLPEIYDFYPMAGSPLVAMIRAPYLRSLTLHDATVPWDTFTYLPSLASLDVKNVELVRVPQDPSPRPAYLSVTPLQSLTFQNCTELVRQFLASANQGGSSGLRFDALEVLGVDLGSEAGVELSWVLLSVNALSVQTLVVKYESNSDDKIEDHSDTESGFDVSKLHLPRLHTLEVVDAYDLSALTPCQASLTFLRRIAYSAPGLAHVRLVLQGLPFIPVPPTCIRTIRTTNPNPNPNEYEDTEHIDVDIDIATTDPTSEPEVCFSLFQNILKETLERFDDALTHLYHTHHPHLHIISVLAHYDFGVDSAKQSVARHYLHSDSSSSIRGVVGRDGVHRLHFYDGPLGEGGRGKYMNRVGEMGPLEDGFFMDYVTETDEYDHADFVRILALLSSFSSSSSSSSFADDEQDCGEEMEGDELLSERWARFYLPKVGRECARSSSWAAARLTVDVGDVEGGYT